MAQMRVGACHHHDLANPERLAQRLEHRTGKLGQIVHEQHAVMREADVARLRAAPAAGARGDGGGVKRLAKGAGPADAALGQKPRDRVSHRTF